MRIASFTSLPLVLVLLVACESGGLPYDGTPGAPTAATFIQNVAFVPVRIDDGEPVHLGIDTGAPIVVVSSAAVGPSRRAR